MNASLSMPIVEPKLCFTCGKKISGRSDKKFCDERCRNAFNNQLNGSNNNYMRKVNNQLRKNRRVLEQLLPFEEHSAEVKKEELLLAGFRFEFHTHAMITNQNYYVFCYEFGYLQLSADRYLLVNRNMENNTRC